MITRSSSRFPPTSLLHDSPAATCSCCLFNFMKWTMLVVVVVVHASNTVMVVCMCDGQCRLCRCSSSCNSEIHEGPWSGGVQWYGYQVVATKIRCCTLLYLAVPDGRDADPTIKHFLFIIHIFTSPNSVCHHQTYRLLGPFNAIAHHGCHFLIASRDKK